MRMRISAALVAATCAGFLAPVPAKAVPKGPPTEGGFYLQGLRSGNNLSGSQDRLEQHRPQGNEDNQEWRFELAGGRYRVKNPTRDGRCLARDSAAGRARLADCAEPDAQWEIQQVRGERYRLKDPGADRYLRHSAGDTTGVELGGTADDLAVWYTTPTSPARSPMPGPDQRTLDQLTFLTTHNSYANHGDGGFAPPFANFFPNQYRKLAEQLGDGARGLMLDIHQTPDGAIMCHGTCTGVSRPRALVQALEDVVNFLRQHRGELVTIFLEDYVKAPVLKAEFDRVPGIYDLMIRPDSAQWNVRARGWPKVADLVSADKRLLVFSGQRCDDGEPAPCLRERIGVMQGSDWTVENYWSMGAGVGNSNWSCYSRYGDIPLSWEEPGFRRLFVMNHFRDVPVMPAPQTDNAKLRDRAERFCMPSARRKPNFLAVDLADKGNPLAAVNALNEYTYSGDTPGFGGPGGRNGR